MLLCAKDHLFFANGQNIHVVFKGRLIQIVPVCCSHLCFYENECTQELISLQCDDERVGLRVWQIDPQTGKLKTFQRYPDPNFHVLFAGLWQHYIVLCSSQGHEKYYDIKTRAICTSLPKTTSRGVAFYQQYSTIWPEHLRTQVWVRPEHDALNVNENMQIVKTSWKWSVIYKKSNWKHTFETEYVALSAGALWGLRSTSGVQSGLQSWSCDFPLRRCPQLWVLAPHFSGHLVERIFRQIWSI